MKSLQLEALLQIATTTTSTISTTSTSEQCAPWNLMRWIF
jgi:hypothetical protein